MSNEVIKKNFIWNIIGSTINSFISFFLMILITRINGINDAGIFSLNFSIACILYVVGIYYGRTYQITDNKYSDSDFINNRFFTCFIMLILSLIIAFLFNYSFDKLIILFILTLFKALEAFSESLYAIIQKKDGLHLVGKSMVIKNIISLLVFLIVDIITKNLIISLLSIIVIYVLIIIFYDSKNAKVEKLDRFNIKNNNELLKLGFNTFAFTILSIFVVNSTKYGMGVQSFELQGIFGIIIMPATIMSLFSQFIINPYLNAMKQSLNNNDYKKFKNISYRIILSTFLIIVFCIIILSIIGIPLLEFIYNIKLSNYYKEFMFIMIGSLFYGLSTLISYILIVIRKTFSQLILLIITAIISIILNYFLIKEYAITGASLSYLFIMLFEFIIYLILIINYFKKLKEGEKR